MEKPGQKAITFVQGRDDILGDDEIDLRVKLSCGHTADPNSVTRWCRNLLNQGKTRFHCPAIVGNGKSCDKEWTYGEIRSIALHTEEEQREFEETMASTAVKQCCEYKKCPGCSTLVERKDPRNLRVLCLICRDMKRGTYEFCWQCLKPWKGWSTSSVRCKNQGCKDYRLEVLQKCKLTDLPGSEIKGCPSIRACPTCGLLIEHKDKCKYIICTQCSMEFCFACLEDAKTCQRGKMLPYFKACTKPMAPRQTSLPAWSGKNVQTQLGTEVNAEGGHDLELEVLAELLSELRYLELLREVIELPVPLSLPVPPTLPPTFPPTPPPTLPPTQPPTPPSTRESTCIIS